MSDYHYKIEQGGLPSEKPATDMTDGEAIAWATKYLQDAKCHHYTSETDERVLNRILTLAKQSLSSGWRDISELGFVTGPGQYQTDEQWKFVDSLMNSQVLFKESGGGFTLLEIGHNDENGQVFGTDEAGDQWPLPYGFTHFMIIQEPEKR